MAARGDLAELIERIERSYEKVFEQHPPLPEEEKVSVGLLDHPLFERARGFKKAGDLIVTSIMEDYNQFNAEIIPAALWLYRHAIELNLKYVRSLLAERVSDEYRFGRTHDLLELWAPVEDYLKGIGLVFDSNTLHFQIAEVIKEFSNLDVDGQLFRYPDSSSPAAKNWVKINFPILKLCVTEVDLFAFGFPEIVTFFSNLARMSEQHDKLRKE